jgi:hypothetical protein
VSTPERAGTWRAFGRGWAVLLGAVLVQAGLQGVLVLGDPVAELGWSFAGLVVASAVVLLLFVWLVVGAALGGVDGSVRAGISAALRRPQIPGWAALLGLTAVGGAILTPYLPPIVLLVAVFLLPAVAAGSVEPWFAGFGVLRRSPGRSVLAIVLYLVLVAVCWVVALAAGLFLTGFLGAVVTWAVFGLVTVLVLCLWCSLFRRSAVGKGAGA